MKFLFLKGNILFMLRTICSKRGYSRLEVFFLNKYVENSRKITDKLEKMSRKDRISRGFGNI